MRSPFDCSKYMRSCWTTLKKEGQNEVYVVHAVNGRLVRTVKSNISPKRWYHVIRLADPDLFQRFMIVIDEDFPVHGTKDYQRRKNTLRYESSFRDCTSYLQEM